MSIVGWTCLAIYAFFVAAAFRPGRNTTGDRGVGLVVPMMMIPLIIVFASALAFVQCRGWMTAVHIIAALLALPILFVGPMIGLQIVRAFLASRRRAIRGTFDGHAQNGIGVEYVMNELGTAVIKSDAPKLRVLLKDNPKIDWSARDRSGFTLLGSAVREVQTTSSRSEALACLRALFEAGAPYQDDAMGSRTKMLTGIVSGYDDELLEVLIKGGGDPNVEDRHGNPALIGAFMEASKASILLDAGAELRSLRSKVEHYRGFDALMCATERGRWNLALLYLERGCDPTYRSPDGRSARSIAEGTDENVNRGKGSANRSGFLRELEKMPVSINPCPDK